MFFLYKIFIFYKTNNDEHFFFNKNINITKPKNKRKISFSNDLQYIDCKTLENDNNIVYSNKIDNKIHLTEHSNELNNCKDFIESENIIHTDRDKMFDEIENEIDSMYFRSIERPILSTSLINTDDRKNTIMNPVINPDYYKDVISESKSGETLWEIYDKMTSNKYKVDMDYKNVEANDIKLMDVFVLGNNKNYGNTKFDTYSL